MESNQKQTLMLFAMFVVCMAMVAVTVIDQGIKRDILQAAKRVRDDLYKAETVLGTTVREAQDDAIQKATSNAGRNSPPAPNHSDHGSGDGSDNVGSPPTIVAKGAANGASGASTKPSTRKSPRVVRPTNPGA